MKGSGLTRLKMVGSSAFIHHQEKVSLDIEEYPNVLDHTFMFEIHVQSIQEAQFQNISKTSKICFHCGYTAARVQCPAVKCAEYNQLTGVINVYHQGCHTCLLKAQNESVIEKIIEEYIQLQPNLPAKELHDVAIVDLLKKGKVKEASFLALHMSSQFVNNMNRRQDYYESEPINSPEAVGELKKSNRFL